MNPKPTFLLAALLALAVVASADEFRYSFSGVLDKRITSSGTDQLTDIKGPTDFALSFTLNYLNDGGAYTLHGLSDISVSVAGWLFTDNGSGSWFNITPGEAGTDLFMQSDTGFTVRTDAGSVRAEGTIISLGGLAGTNPNDIPGFTAGSVMVYGYCFDSQICNYVLNGTLSPVGEDGATVLLLLVVGMVVLVAGRHYRPLVLRP